MQPINTNTISTHHPCHIVSPTLAYPSTYLQLTSTHASNYSQQPSLRQQLARLLAFKFARLSSRSLGLIDSLQVDIHIQLQLSHWLHASTLVSIWVSTEIELVCKSVQTSKALTSTQPQSTPTSLTNSQSADAKALTAPFRIRPSTPTRLALSSRKASPSHESFITSAGLAQLRMLASIHLLSISTSNSMHSIEHSRW
jgi:hypothetical protein